MRAATRVLVPLVFLAACGRGSGPARTAEVGAFHGPYVGASADPTVRGARLLPENVDDKVGYGAEAGGFVRGITSGIRVLTGPDGAIVAAEDRFPQAPQIT